jgi:hypothetical protein
MGQLLQTPSLAEPDFGLKYSPEPRPFLKIGNVSKKRINWNVLE